MSVAYTVGWPGWKIAARLGIPLRVKVKISLDKEAGVYVAICDNFLPEFAIACEGEDFESLKKEIKACLEDGLEITLGNISRESQLRPLMVVR